MNSLFNIPDDFTKKWQEIADVLANIINMPAALIMKTENEFMQVFISSNSENNPYKPGDKEHWHGSYCEAVIKSQTELLIPNALKDEGWDKNPDIKLGMISYLGYPLNFPDKTPFGTICVLDKKENHFSEKQKQLLLQFKSILELDLALIQTIKIENPDDSINQLLLKNKELQSSQEKAITYENRYHVLFENLIDEVHIWKLVKDNKGNIVTWELIDANPSALKAWGKKKENVIGEKASEIFDYDVESLFLPIVKEIFETGKPRNWETYFPPADQFLSMRSVPFGDYFISTGRDISEHKKIEEETEKYSYLLSNITDNILDMVMVSDMKGIAHYASNSHNRLGYKPEELVGKNAFDLVHPDDLNDLVLVFKEFITTKVNTKSEYRYRMADGSYTWLETVAKYLNDNEVLFSSRIITERKQYELELELAKEKAERSEEQLKTANIELEQNNERLESLLRISQYNTNSVQELLDFALKESINLTNSRIGYIYFYNEKTKKFTLNTWSKEVMKECNVSNQQVEYDLYSTGCWGEAVRQRKPIIINDYSAENPLKKGIPEGHVKLKRFLTIPVFANNKIVATAGVANKKEEYTNSDVRQLQLLMDSVWKITDRLNMVKELSLAKEKAEEANRLKTEFLNNMSHEIRTPMNGIIGFSEMIDKPDISQEKRNYYSKIVQNSSHQLLRIIDDILEIATLEARQEKLNETEFCLNDFLMELFTIFNLKSKERNIPLYIKKALRDSESRIISDKTKLHKIISNLCENALKYTNSGFIELGYYIENQSIILYVKDTGIGISPENHKIIFERFSQEDKEMSRKYGGLGLGLSICKENATLLNGNITLESEKGKGSVFYLSIPYKPVQTKTGTDSNTASIQETTEVYTILVAEDEEINYLYIETILENRKDLSYKLIHTKNGKEAVEACFTENIDLVLMDLKMPVMNGFEATEKIKAKFPDLPIIAQTAYSRESDRKLALKHGCDDFITKPINKEKLYAMINKYLNIK